MNDLTKVFANVLEFDADVYVADYTNQTKSAVGVKIADKPFEPRKICFDKHCYACTAGAGSSCGGTTEG